MRAEECCGDQAMACQTFSSKFLQPQKQLFITGKVFSETGNGLPPLGSSGMPSTTKGVSPSNRSNVLSHVAPYIHTVGLSSWSSAGLRTTLAVGESRGFLWNRSSSSACWELYVLLFETGFGPQSFKGAELLFHLLWELPVSILSLCLLWA